MRQPRIWLAATLALCLGRVTFVPTAPHFAFNPPVHDSPTKRQRCSSGAHEGGGDWRGSGFARRDLSTIVKDASSRRRANRGSRLPQDAAKARRPGRCLSVIKICWLPVFGFCRGLSCSAPLASHGRSARKRRASLPRSRMSRVPQQLPNPSYTIVGGALGSHRRRARAGEKHIGKLLKGDQSVWLVFRFVGRFVLWFVVIGCLLACFLGWPLGRLVS